MVTRLHRPKKPKTIKGLSELRRPQIIGALKIGVRVIGCKKCKMPERLYEGDDKARLVCPGCGNTVTDKKTGKHVYVRPDKLDHFKIIPEDERVVPIVEEIYGDEPKTVDIKLPLYALATSKAPEPEIELETAREMIFPQSLTRFVKSALLCEGDGERAVCYENDPKGVEIECNGEECDFYKKEMCQVSAQLFVSMYRLPSWGVYRLMTRGSNTIIDINTALDSVYGIAEMLAGALPDETVATLLPKMPLKLRLKKGRGRDDKGRATIFYKVVMDLGEDLMRRLALSTLALEPRAPEVEVKALPTAGEPGEVYEPEEDRDARRTELIARIKELPPYKLDPEIFSAGKIEYEEMAEHSERATRWAEAIIGRREPRLKFMTTEELEKVRAAQEDLANGGAGKPAEQEVEPVTEEELDEAFAGRAEDIRAAEAEALVGLIKRLKLKASDVARFANEHFKPEEKWTAIKQKDIRETWVVDASVSFREYIEKQFAEALEKMVKEGG